MDESEKLNRDEWIVVLSLIVLVAAVTLVTHKHWFSIYPQGVSQPHYLYDTKIQVKVEGAVECPGFYEFDKGIIVEDALKTIKLASNADLKKIPLKRKLRDGQTLKIPAIEYITIYLKGAFKHTGMMIVPKGTLMEDLMGWVELKEGAVIKNLQQKRPLKDNEEVCVDFFSEKYCE